MNKRRVKMMNYKLDEIANLDQEIESLECKYEMAKADLEYYQFLYEQQKKDTDYWKKAFESMFDIIKQFAMGGST